MPCTILVFIEGTYALRYLTVERARLELIRARVKDAHRLHEESFMSGGIARGPSSALAGVPLQRRSGTAPHAVLATRCRIAAFGARQPLRPAAYREPQRAISPGAIVFPICPRDAMQDHVRHRSHDPYVRLSRARASHRRSRVLFPAPSRTPVATHTQARPVQPSRPLISLHYPSTHRAARGID